MKLKLFDYSKWELLEMYNYGGDDFSVQVRMNNRTGLKHFKVTRITPMGRSSHLRSTVGDINDLFVNSKI